MTTPASLVFNEGTDTPATPTSGHLTVFAKSDNTLNILDSTGTVSALSTGSGLPSQAGQGGKYLTTDGTSALWNTVAVSPGGSDGVIQVNNGGTFGGQGAFRVNFGGSTTNVQIGGPTGVRGLLTLKDSSQNDVFQLFGDDTNQPVIGIAGVLRIQDNVFGSTVYATINRASSASAATDLVRKSDLDALVLPPATLTTLPTGTVVGQICVVTDATAGPVPTVWNGTNWIDPRSNAAVA
jgi:hypothetical protein